MDYAFAKLLLARFDMATVSPKDKSCLLCLFVAVMIKRQWDFRNEKNINNQRIYILASLLDFGTNHSMHIRLVIIYKCTSEGLEWGSCIH